MHTGSEISLNTFPARKVLLWAGALVLGAAGAALLYFFVDPAQVAIFPPCLFHELTGLDCPGCGGQRAFHQLLHGHLIAAIRLNAMFVVSLPVFAGLGTRYLMRYWRAEPMDFRFRWLWVYGAAWVVFAVLRNLPVPCFQWFAA